MLMWTRIHSEDPLSSWWRTDWCSTLMSATIWSIMWRNLTLYVAWRISKSMRNSTPSVNRSLNARAGTHFARNWRRWELCSWTHHFWPKANWMLKRHLQLNRTVNLSFSLSWKRNFKDFSKPIREAAKKGRKGTCPDSKGTFAFT